MKGQMKEEKKGVMSAQVRRIYVLIRSSRVTLHAYFAIASSFRVLSRVLLLFLSQFLPRLFIPRFLFSVWFLSHHYHARCGIYVKQSGHYEHRSSDHSSRKMGTQIHNFRMFFSNRGLVLGQEIPTAKVLSLFLSSSSSSSSISLTLILPQGFLDQIQGPG